MCIRDSVTIDVDPFQSILLIVFLDVCIYLFPQGSILSRSCVKPAKIERRNQLSPAVSGLFFPFKKIDQLSDKTPLLFSISRISFSMECTLFITVVFVMVCPFVFIDSAAY